LRAQFEQGCFDKVFLESKWQKMSIAALTNNSTEDLIASLFAEALGFEGIALDDDFFRHGGTSIQAVHLMSLLQSKFGPDAPRIDDLFRCPTIRSMAELILRADDTSDPNMHSLNQIATRCSALEGQHNRRSARINSRLTNGGVL
jgi:acyl carrier protein